jgi:hypothetical protein
MRGHRLALARCGLPEAVERVVDAIVVGYRGNQLQVLVHWVGQACTYPQRMVQNASRRGLLSTDHLHPSLN